MVAEQDDIRELQPFESGTHNMIIQHCGLLVRGNSAADDDDGR
jgi:hypothetical protein